LEHILAEELRGGTHIVFTVIHFLPHFSAKFPLTTGFIALYGTVCAIGLFAIMNDVSFLNHPYLSILLPMTAMRSPLFFTVIVLFLEGLWNTWKE
jgi:hypothetical protein